MADYFARYAADHLFDEIEEIGIRDGSNLEIPGAKGISFGFSIWTTIEECTQPAIIWEADRGWYTVEPFAELEKFFLPEGIGEVEVAHVEHEEVIHLGRNAAPAQGQQEGDLQVRPRRRVHAGHGHLPVGEHRQEGADQGRSGVKVAPRDVIAAAAPDPNEIGKKYVGQTAAGTWVKGKKDGMEREVYLYQVADNQECVEKYGTQVVVAQTAFTPGRHARAARHGQLQGTSRQPGERACTSPRSSTPTTTSRLMPAYEFPGGLLEMESEYKRRSDIKVSPRRSPSNARAARSHLRPAASCEAAGRFTGCFMCALRGSRYTRGTQPVDLQGRPR